MPILGDGVKIGYETGSPLAFALIPDLDELSDIPIPVPDELETTTHGTNGYHTYGDGLKKVPDFTTTHFYDGADTAIDAIIAAAFASTQLTIRIETPADAGKTLFKGLEMDVKVRASMSTPKDGWQRVTFTWKYAGNFDSTGWATAGATSIT